MASTATDDAASLQTAYNDLKRLTPSLAAELDHLRASLREHNLWLQRYGQGQGQSDDEALAAVPAGLPTLTTRPPAESSSETEPTPERTTTASPPPAFTPSANPPTSGPPAPTARTSQASAPPPQQSQPPSTTDTTASPDVPSYASIVDNTLPPYAASEVPLYSSAVRDDVMQRRDQLIEWLREGEEVLRDYSSRLANLAVKLNLPAEDADALGTWNEAEPDNALPSYTMIEGREELMVGGVGEVPPTYARGSAVDGTRQRV